MARCCQMRPVTTFTNEQSPVLIQSEPVRLWFAGLLTHGAARKAPHGIKRADLEKRRHEKHQTNQADPMPPLNRKPVLQRVCDQRQADDDSHILVNRSNIYRHDTSPSDE